MQRCRSSASCPFPKRTATGRTNARRRPALRFSSLQYPASKMRFASTTAAKIAAHRLIGYADAARSVRPALHYTVRAGCAGFSPSRSSGASFETLLRDRSPQPLRLRHRHPRSAALPIPRRRLGPLAPPGDRARPLPAPSARVPRNSQMALATPAPSAAAVIAAVQPQILGCRRVRLKPTESSSPVGVDCILPTRPTLRSGPTPASPPAPSGGRDLPPSSAPLPPRKTPPDRHNASRPVDPARRRDADIQLLNFVPCQSFASIIAGPPCTFVL